METQKVGNLILQDELGRLLGAEALPNTEEQSFADLFTDAERRTDAQIALRLDFELVELQRVGNRPCEPDAR